MSQRWKIVTFSFNCNLWNRSRNVLFQIVDVFGLQGHISAGSFSGTNQYTLPHSLLLQSLIRQKKMYQPWCMRLVRTKNQVNLSNI